MKQIAKIFSILALSTLFLVGCNKEVTLTVEETETIVEELQEELTPEVDNTDSESEDNSGSGGILLPTMGIQKKFPLEYNHVDYSPTGDEFVVKTQGEFKNTLSKAKPGDIIKLEPGNYGDIVMYGKEFPKGKELLIIGGGRETIIESIKVNHSSGIEFRNIMFGHTVRDGEKDWSRSMAINHGANIRIIASYFMSSNDDDYTNDITGVGTTFSSELVFHNNHFSHLSKGVIFDGAKDSVIANNTFEKLSIDGINVAGGSNNILIEGNRMKDFFTCDLTDEKNCKNHPDFIQIYNDTGKSDNLNIKILSNTLFQGKGSSVQSIFVQSNSVDFNNKGVFIKNNLIYNTHLHGISVYDSEDVEIENNTVLQVKNTVVTKISTPQINVYKTQGVVLKNNIMSGEYYNENSDISAESLNYAVGTSGYENVFVGEELIGRENFYVK